LRFADPLYTQGPFNPEEVRRWLPVDLYVGGAEHAVMHLLYARFWTKVLADAGLLHFREPFPRLRSQGVLHAADGKRMSKSRGNVVTPDEVVERHGADILRLHLLDMAPFDHNVVWEERGIAGARRFLERVWRVCLEPDDEGRQPGSAAPEDEEILIRKVHRTIRRVTEEIEALTFNTAGAALAEMVNAMTVYREQQEPAPAGSTWSWAVETLIKLLAPFAPHITEELWARRGGAFSVHQQPWPEYDPALAAERVVTLVVQVNGKVRDRIDVPAEIGDEEARRLALASAQVQRYLAGRRPRNVIVVPGRLVNVVV
jgi:leucyl-tRNA synthetase